MNVKEELCSDHELVVANSSISTETDKSDLGTFCEYNCCIMQCGDVCTGLMSSEISVEGDIKLEDDKTLEGNTNSYTQEIITSRDVDSELTRAAPKAVKRRQWHISPDIRRGQVSKYFGRILKCPKCTAAFKFGFQSTGPRLLIDHVGKHHAEFQTDCLISIMRRHKAEFNSLLHSKGRNCTPSL